MAKTQETTNGQSSTSLEAIAKLESQLADLDLPQELKDKMLAQARDGVSGQALGQITQDVQRLLSNERYAGARSILKKQKISLQVSVDENGNIAEITHRVTRQTAKRAAKKEAGSDKAPAPGSRVFVVNGKEYARAADAARDLGIDFKGDSAVRTLKRAAEAGQITYEEREAEPETAAAE